MNPESADRHFRLSVTTEITWTITPTSVATITEDPSNPDRAIVTAVAEGQARLTANADSLSASAEVTVNTSPVAAEVTSSGTTLDYYNVSVNVRNAVSPVKSVSIYTWSEPDQSDMNCKFVPPLSANANSFTYTFPVNDTLVNEHYIRADSIKINVYVTLDDNSVYFLGALDYDWMDAASEGRNVAYIGYSQNYGFDLPTVFDGVMSGTEGRGIALEGVRISSPIPGIEVITDVHVQDIGWIENIADGTYAGTMGQDKQIEALRFYLVGPNASNYRIEYQVHGENYGWQGWISQGQVAGTVGLNLQLEALQVRIVPA